MNSDTKMIMEINNMEDINKLKNTPSIKYINLNITSPNLEVIYYLLENGQNYRYSEKIDDKKGYIYVPYEVFKKSTIFILDVINNIPSNLTKVEVARYFYITIGKNIGYDINIKEDKNETLDLEDVNTINNIWGSIYKAKGTNVSFTKLYLYFCKLMNIKCKLKLNPKTKNYQNILTINNREIDVNITDDIPFIQAGFKTKYFNSYNDNLEIDKKISYIQDNYCDVKLDEMFRNLDYNSNDIFNIILLLTGKLINASDIKPIELGMIYEIIFQKYCPNFNITINNLYIVNEKNQKEHFILISYDNKSYSFNYSKNMFVEISSDDILTNINEQRIGIYKNENLPFISNKEKTI